jgi:hypothetical protein
LRVDVGLRVRLSDAAGADEKDGSGKDEKFLHAGILNIQNCSTSL